MIILMNYFLLCQCSFRKHSLASTAQNPSWTRQPRPSMIWRQPIFPSVNLPSVHLFKLVFHSPLSIYCSSHLLLTFVLLNLFLCLFKHVFSFQQLKMSSSSSVPKVFMIDITHSFYCLRLLSFHVSVSCVLFMNSLRAGITSWTSLHCALHIIWMISMIITAIIQVIGS